jgi:hypothetical protein
VAVRDIDDLGVKEVAAIAGEYPAWESPSTAQPFVFDSDVVGGYAPQGLWSSERRALRNIVYFP